MRRLTYIYAILFIMAIVFVVVNCTDEDLVKNGQENMEEFSIQEAKDYFQVQMAENLILSRSLSSEDNKTVSPGDFIPDWDIAVGASMNELASYSIPITPTCRFKAIYVDIYNGIPSVGKVNVYQKLVIVKDTKSKKLSQYILTLIPSKTHDSKYGKKICDNFVNCAGKGGFTGVAIYSSVYSQVTVRINIYKNGTKMKGVFLLDNSVKDISSEKIELARSLVSMVAIQKMNTVSTRGEDAGWDIDYGWLDEVVIIPDPDWDAGNDQWLEDTRPGEVVDPDPEPDQGQPEEDLVDNGQENNPDENILPLTELEKQMVNRVLLELEKLKNVNVQNYQIQKITFCHVPAKTMNGILLLCEMFFQSAQLQDIDRMAIIWHEIHHIDKKHYSTSLESHQVIGDPIILNVPPEIEQIIRDRMAQEFEGTNMTPATIEAWYQQSITVTHFNSPEYYENEIETHRNERENFPNVSKFYENERTYLEWYYEEMLRIANEQLKK